MEQHHIIGRMRIGVQAARRQEAMQHQQAIGFYLHTQNFTRELETLLNRLVPNGEYVDIPLLKIKLLCPDAKGFGPSFLLEFERSLHTALSNRPTGTRIRTSRQHVEFVQEFFLKFGSLPSDAEPGILPEFLTALRSLPTQSQPELEALILSLGSQPGVWKRLFYILGAEGMRGFLQRVALSHKDQLQPRIFLQTNEPVLIDLAYGQGLISDVKNSASRTELPPAEMLSSPVLKPASKLVSNASTESVASEEVAADALMESSSLKKQAAQQEWQQEASLGLQVANAGIVLLWHSFGQLLRKLGYVADRQFVSDEAGQKAIWLLHYISTGTLRAEEDGLLLNKVLCAWPEDEPVDPALTSDSEACAAADEMLLGYITTWKKDRTFSVEWFRTAFLRREGRLLKRPDGNWQLEIDKRTEDVIIDKVSIVKYPWMPGLLFVQW